MRFKIYLVWLTQSNHRLERLKRRFLLSELNHPEQIVYRRRLVSMIYKEIRYNEYLRRKVGFK